MWIFMKFHHFNGILWNFTIFHELTHNSMKIHKNGAFCAPGPRTYWIPKDFQWFWRHPSPRKCTEITKLCGISRISRIFTKKAEMTEIHDFLSISRFGVAEPSRNLPRRYVYKGFSPRGRGGTHFSKILWNQLNSVKCDWFHEISLL